MYIDLHTAEGLARQCIFIRYAMHLYLEFFSACGRVYLQLMHLFDFRAIAV